MIISNKNHNINYLEYLTENFVFSDINNIPIIENKLLFSNIIDFMDYNDLSLQECIQNIEEANDINFNDLLIIFNEEDVIIDPTILCLFENFAIKPISENNDIYLELEELDNIILNDNIQTIEESISSWIYDKLHGSDNEKIEKIRRKIKDAGEKDIENLRDLKDIINKYGNNEAMLKEKRDKINKTRRKQAELVKKFNELNVKKINTINKYDDHIATATAVTTGLGLVGGIGFATNKFLKYRKEKNASKLSKIIAALRKKYRSVIIQADKNPRKAGILKQIAAKILKVIDVLMRRLQEITR